MNTPQTRQRTELIRQPIPKGIDVEKAHAKLVKLIAQQHGGGWEIESIDPVAGLAIIVRTKQVVEVTASEAGDDVLEVKLPSGTKPTDGAKHASKLEDANPGYEMTKFEPWLRRALLTRIDPVTSRARQAISAALGCKPWDIQVTPRKPDANGDIGFDLELHDKYLPAKHDDKLEEVAVTVIGKPGWYIETDPVQRTASIIPALPPTFPAGIPYPLDRLREGDIQLTKFGRFLPKPGQDEGDEAVLDWVAGGNVLVAGLPRSGKSVVLNSIIAGSLAEGSELVIVDTFDKCVDYLWCKDWVRPGGWGCDSLQHSVTALRLVLEEGKRRADILKHHGAVNWLELPESERFAPILVVVDELSGLTSMEKVPPGLPKKHPDVVEVLYTNLLGYSVSKGINDIISMYGFVGMRVIPATQITNNNTGVSPALKNKIMHRLLQGSNPSETARAQAFSDPKAVPVVPANVREDAKAARGVGSAELGGHEPGTYKGYYATPDDYRTALKALGLKATPEAIHAPTKRDIERLCPKLDDGDGDGEGSELEGQPGFDAGPRIDPNTGEQMTGFAKANEARRQLDATAGTTRRKKKADPYDMPAASEVVVRKIGE